MLSSPGCINGKRFFDTQSHGFTAFGFKSDFPLRLFFEPVFLVAPLVEIIFLCRFLKELFRVINRSCIICFALRNTVIKLLKRTADILEKVHRFCAPKGKIILQFGKSCNFRALLFLLQIGNNAFTGLRYGFFFLRCKQLIFVFNHKPQLFHNFSHVSELFQIQL